MAHGMHGWKVTRVKGMGNDNRKEDVSKTLQSNLSALRFSLNKEDMLFFYMNPSWCRSVAEFRIT